MPPPRNLFTGRTPEAFSYSYSQGTNTQNNLLSSASTQSPIKTVDYTTEQAKAKPNNGPISPQITFLASQGAHVPSANSIQDTISRMFTTEKPMMPQLVNYEAGIKETDQEANKGLWRWQYGLNANSINPNTNKETISRSFGEGDDVIINFNDMTPHQYTKMVQSQFESNPENVVVQQDDSRQQLNSDYTNNFNNYYRNEGTKMQRAIENQNIISNSYTISPVSKPPTSYTEKVKQTAYDQSEEWLKQIYNLNQIPQFPTTVEPIENRDTRPVTPRLITQKDFMSPTVPSQIVTQSYNFEDTYYEPRKLHTLSTDSSEKFEANVHEDASRTSFENGISTSNPWTNIIANQIKTTTTHQPKYSSSVADFKFTDFIVHENKSDYKPITTTTTEASHQMETTTTASAADIIANNIFLKNLFNSEKPQSKVEEITEKMVPETQHENKNPETLNVEEFETPKIKNKISEEPKKVVYNLVGNQNKIETYTKLEADQKTDKVTKLIPLYRPKPVDDKNSYNKNKPIDVTEILNYFTMKNLFESSKMKPKSKTVSNNYDHRNEIRFIPVQQENDESNINVSEQKPSNNLRTLNFEQESKQTNLKPLHFEQEHKTNNFKTLNFDQDENKSNNFRTLNYEQEVRGNIKNYKVLHRNNNVHKYDSSTQLKTELSPPPLKVPSLPPLGRAGPSMKSYLPPIYV